MRAALSKAINAAVKSEKLTKFLANTMKTTPSDLGPAETEKMMYGTSKTIKVLLKSTK